MISCQNLNYSVNDLALLHDVSCSFQQEAITAIIGANGAGKSTLLKAILGKISPQSGHVIFGDKALSDWSNTELASRRAYMAQSSRMQMSLPVYEYLSLARLHATESQVQTDAVVEHIITQLNLETLAKKTIDRLSGGEWQRVDLARAWCQLYSSDGFHNTLLLLDEPGSALDIYQTQQLYQYLLDFKHQGGTVVIVEHDINTAARYCDQLVLLKSGRIVDAGRVSASFNQHNINACFNVSGQVIANRATGLMSFVL